MSETNHPLKDKSSPRFSQSPKHPAAHADEGGEGNWLVSYADMMTLLVGFFIILLSFSTTDEQKFEELKEAVTKEFGGAYQTPFLDLAERIREELNKLALGDKFVVKQTPVGVNISIMGPVFFDTGSAVIRDEALVLMSRLIQIIQSEAREFNIVIEGHTDDVPIGHNLQYKSNWELSSVRACRVLDIFESRGFKKTQLTAVGYADSRPLLPNRTAEGVVIPENQSQNRRVVMKLIKPGEPVIGRSSPSEAEGSH